MASSLSLPPPQRKLAGSGVRINNNDNNMNNNNDYNHHDDHDDDDDDHDDDDRNNIVNSTTDGKSTSTELVKAGSSSSGRGGGGASVSWNQQMKQGPLSKAPTYSERCKAASDLAKMPPQERKQKKLFVPRSLVDFDDGGAFPEIHVAQYPRHMGNPHLKIKNKATSAATTSGTSSSSSSSSGAQTISRAIVNVEVDKDGEISYDAIVKGGTNANKTVYTRYEDIRGGEARPEDVAKPTEEEEAETARRTQEALQKLIAGKTALNKPSGSALVNADTSRDIEQKTQFIKYTPRPDAPGYNPSASQRVVQMVPAKVDPMMPPKHQHKKAPRGPAEDPVPVLHAPPRKLTKEEKEQWNVPACISNWKNSRGYTIPLDKRLAADGRGLREHTINSNFATLSESLYVAERQARQEVRLRAQVQKKLASQEKDRREEELRELANQARLERSGFNTTATASTNHLSAHNQNNDIDDNDNYHDEEEDIHRGGDRGSKRPIQEAVSDGDDSADARPTRRSRKEANRDDEDVDDGDDDGAVAAAQRERLRLERRREREKELRQENNMELKKRKLEAERDVSEKIALGVHTGQGGGTGEVDSRLYNQSGGMDSGFGAEDEYNTYSKPLFDRQGVTSASIYRPTRGETEHNADESYDKLLKSATSKFQPSKGFAGAEGGTDIQAGARSAPVQFEKSKN
jgi:SNW domain-containing protein 1